MDKSFQPLGGLEPTKDEDNLKVSKVDKVVGAKEKDLLHDIDTLVDIATACIAKMKEILNGTVDCFEGETAEMVRTNFGASEEIVSSSIKQIHLVLRTQIQAAIGEFQKKENTSQEIAENL